MTPIFSTPRLRSFVLAGMTFCGVATAAAAEPILGVGLSFAFGSQSRLEAGAGARLFSSNKPDSYVASIGLDYLFTSRRIRPTIGAAHLSDNSYIGLDMGFDPQGGNVDYGASIGLLNNK